MEAVVQGSYPERLRAFHRSRHGQLVDDTLVDRLRELTPGSKVLDYGCGTGEFLMYLRYRLGYKGLGLFGYDPVWGDHVDSPGISICKDGLMPKQVDAVVCSHVLGHVSQPHFWLFLMLELLKPGGLLLLVVPSRAYGLVMTPVNVLSGYRSDPTLLHRWLPWELKSVVGRVGFAVQSVAGISPVLGGLFTESTLVVARKMEDTWP